MKPAHSMLTDGPKGHKRERPILSRAHEQGIFVFYSIAGAGLFYKCRTTAWVGEMAIAYTWSSMILAISFLEAWVTFRAPFLSRFVAVDAGRHAFAAL